jgi:hypothetical protein
MVDERREVPVAAHCKWRIQVGARSAQWVGHILQNKSISFYRLTVGELKIIPILDRIAPPFTEPAGFSA